MVLALDGTGHSVVERHCDKPGAGVDIIQDKREGDSVRFPLIGFRAEVALHFLKDLHPFHKHVVAVDLAEKGAGERQIGTAGSHGDTVKANPVKS